MAQQFPFSRYTVSSRKWKKKVLNRNNQLHLIDYTKPMLITIFLKIF